MGLSPRSHIFRKSFGIYGGDDGARTRDLCRDSREEARNLMESGGTDGSFQLPEEPVVTGIVLIVSGTSALLTSARCQFALQIEDQSRAGNSLLEIIGRTLGGVTFR